MTSPLHADYYADCAVQVAAPILENVRLAKDTYRVRFAAPEIARRIVPGQFLMLRLAGLNDPLIGRPLALYDTVLSPSGKPEAVDVVYLVKGKLTSRLGAAKPGQVLDVWGPLGNGFSASGSADFGIPNGPEFEHNDSQDKTHLVIVAGGIGQTPFLALTQEALGLKRYGDPHRIAPAVDRVTFCYGARSSEYVATRDFEKYVTDMRLSTDDGSLGHHGFATDLLAAVLEERWGRFHIVCCGPESMMEAVAKIALAASVPCQISLETPMACGIGICFTCVAKIKQDDGSWDYKRTCVEGPVFDAVLIEW